MNGVFQWNHSCIMFVVLSNCNFDWLLAVNIESDRNQRGAVAENGHRIGVSFHLPSDGACMWHLHQLNASPSFQLDYEFWLEKCRVRWAVSRFGLAKGNQWKIINFLFFKRALKMEAFLGFGQRKPLCNQWISTKRKFSRHSKESEEFLSIFPEVDRQPEKSKAFAGIRGKKKQNVKHRIWRSEMMTIRLILGFVLL